MDQLIKGVAPHIHSGNSTQKIMLDVILALLPASIAAVYIFGIKALWIILTCVISCVCFEALFNVICKKPQTISDLSAIVTGLLLGLNLSTNVELWQCVVGSFFAIVIVKCLFGGLGKNFANPAISGRVFMLITFSSVAGGAMPVIATELEASATPLELIKNGLDLPSFKEMLLGVHGGAVGETCIVALVIGLIYLLVRKVITLHTPVAFIGTVFVLYLLFTQNINTALYEILSGGLFLGAIFMATDYATTPLNVKGKTVFGIGCGIITFIIRYFCSYPEGVSFSILIMNLLVSYIEKYTASTPIGGVKHAK